MSDQPLTGCHGIMWHQDTVWKRCPKADECKRYIDRYGNSPVSRMCQTVEFEHFVKAND